MTNWIKQYREERDWSQEKMARTLDVSVRTIVRWEQGTKPSPLALRMLEHEFNIKWEGR